MSAFGAAISAILASDEDSEADSGSGSDSVGSSLTMVSTALEKSILLITGVSAAVKLEVLFMTKTSNTESSSKNRRFIFFLPYDLINPIVSHFWLFVNLTDMCCNMIIIA